MSEVRPSIDDLREHVKSAAKRLIVDQAQLDACRVTAELHQPLIDARREELKRATDTYRDALLELADGIAKIPEPGPLYGL
jgi:hypothetical protein